MTAQPTVKLPDCPAWCHGHTEGDAFCTSETVEVGGRSVGAGAWIFRYPERSVAQVRLDCADHAALTAAQTRAFAAELIRLADMIDGTS